MTEDHQDMRVCFFAFIHVPPPPPVHVLGKEWGWGVGGYDSHMKGMGMLVILLRHVIYIEFGNKSVDKTIDF